MIGVIGTSWNVRCEVLIATLAYDCTALFDLRQPYSAVELARDQAIGPTHEAAAERLRR